MGTIRLLMKFAGHSWHIFSSVCTNKIPLERFFLYLNVDALLFKWGLCELRHCPRFPWIWGRADRLGGTPKTDRCVLQRKVWMGKKRERVEFRLWTEWGRVTCFQDGEVVRVVYGCSKRPRQIEPGPRISMDWRPTWSAALSDRHEVSRQKTSCPSMWGFFF